MDNTKTTLDLSTPDGRSQFWKVGLVASLITTVLFVVYAEIRGLVSYSSSINGWQIGLLTGLKQSVQNVLVMLSLVVTYRFWKESAHQSWIKAVGWMFVGSIATVVFRQLISGILAMAFGESWVFGSFIFNFMDTTKVLILLISLMGIFGGRMSFGKAILLIVLAEVIQVVFWLGDFGAKKDLYEGSGLLLDFLLNGFISYGILWVGFVFVFVFWLRRHPRVSWQEAQFEKGNNLLSIWVFAFLYGFLFLAFVYGYLGWSLYLASNFVIYLRAIFLHFPAVVAYSLAYRPTASRLQAWRITIAIFLMIQILLLVIDGMAFDARRSDFYGVYAINMMVWFGLFAVLTYDKNKLETKNLQKIDYQRK